MAGEAGGDSVSGLVFPILKALRLGGVPFSGPSPGEGWRQLADCLWAPRHRVGRLQGLPQLKSRLGRRRGATRVHR